MVGVSGLLHLFGIIIYGIATSHLSNVNVKNLKNYKVDIVINLTSFLLINALILNSNANGYYILNFIKNICVMTMYFSTYIHSIPREVVARNANSDVEGLSIVSYRF